MAPSSHASALRTRRRFTAYTVNIVRLTVSIVGLIVLIGIFWFGLRVNRQNQDNYTSITNSSINTRTALIEAKETLEEIRTVIKEIPDKNNRVLVEAITTINAKTETEAIQTRKDIASHAEPMAKKMDAIQQNTGALASQLSESEKAITEMQKASLAQLALVKAPQPIVEQNEVRLVAVQQVTNVVNGIKIPESDPERNFTLFKQGGASKVFSKADIQYQDVILANVRGIRATLIYKSGLFKTWSREVEVYPGEKFDILDAAQVVFWSDSYFWISWKKYPTYPR